MPRLRHINTEVSGDHPAVETVPQVVPYLGSSSISTAKGRAPDTCKNQLLRPSVPNGFRVPPGAAALLGFLLGPPAVGRWVTGSHANLPRGHGFFSTVLDG